MLKSTIVYAIADAANRGVAIVLLPFYTFYLTASEFGEFELFNTVANFVGVLVIFGAVQGLLRRYFLVENKKTLVSNIALISIVVSVLVSILLLIIGLLVFKDQQFAEPLVIFSLIVYSCTFSLYSILMSFLRASEKLIQYLFYTVIYVFFQLAFILAGLVVFELGSVSKVVGLSMAGILPTTILIFKYRSLFDLSCVSQEQVKEALRFNTPLLGSNIVGWAMTSIDKFILAFVLGLESLGVFSLALQVCQVFKVCVDSFLKAYNVTYYRNFKSGIEKKDFWELMVIVSLLGVLFSSLSQYFIPIYVDESFSGAGVLMPLIMMSRIALIGNYTYTLNSYANSRTYDVFKMNAIVAILSIPLSYYSVVNFGVNGIVFSMTVSPLITGWVLFKVSNCVNYISTVALSILPFVLMVVIHESYSGIWGLLGAMLIVFGVALTNFVFMGNKSDRPLC